MKHTHSPGIASHKILTLYICGKLPKLPFNWLPCNAGKMCLTQGKTWADPIQGVDGVASHPPLSLAYLYRILWDIALQPLSHPHSILLDYCLREIGTGEIEREVSGGGGEQCYSVLLLKYFVWRYAVERGRQKTWKKQLNLSNWIIQIIPMLNAWYHILQWTVNSATRPSTLLCEILQSFIFRRVLCCLTASELDLCVHHSLFLVILYIW